MRPHPYHALVLGVPQSGKSTLARQLARSWPRVVYFDPTGSYDQVRGVFAVKPGDRWAAIASRSSVYRLVVQAATDPHADLSEELIAVAIETRRAGQLRGPVLLVADEVHAYKDGAGYALAALHYNGHKHGVATLFVSQRAVNIPAGARATATHIYSLRQDEPRDLEALAERCGEEYAARVAAWKPGDGPIVWEQPPLWRNRPPRGDRKGTSGP